MSTQWSALSQILNKMLRIAVVLAVAIAVSARPEPRPAAIIKPMIIGGEEASSGEFPYQLSMEYFGSHSCGAVHIRNDRALCAAHCVDGRSPFEITIRHGTNDRGTGPQVSVSDIKMHPSYVADGSQGFPNDISLLFTESMTGPNTASIALPSGGADFGGDTCVISGWGDITAGGGVLPTKLQKKTISILTKSECEGYWGQYQHDKHVCLWDKNDQAGSCQGDSGGPLTCTESGSKVVAGVTSWGVVGCEGLPSVYTRVGNYLSWINSNIN